MKMIDSLVRENIKSLVPYSSARDDYKGSEGVFLDANENPFGTLNRYPDPHHLKLRSAISRAMKTPLDNIFVGNGSDEVIDLIFRIFCNPGRDKAMTMYPSYGMYEVSAAVNDISVIKVPLNSNFETDAGMLLPYLGDEDLRLIFFCSPNNPTGNSLPIEEITRIIEEFRGMVVIDEAYIDFSEKPSFISLTDKYSNLIVLRTFSKAWGGAGIRVGMAFADKEIIKYMYRVKPPYNISTLNQDAALRRLARPGKYRRQIETIKAERGRMKEILKKIPVVEAVYPSDANFLLVKVKDADLIYNYLVSNRIIVRNRSSVILNCLRITIGTKAENDKLIDVLKTFSI